MTSSGPSGAHGNGSTGSTARAAAYVLPGIAAALFALAGPVPVAGYAAMLILISGIMLLTVHRGAAAGAAGTLAAAVVFYMVRRPVYGAPESSVLASFVFETAGAALAVGMALRAGAGALRSLAAGTAAAAVLFVLLAADVGGLRYGYEAQLGELRSVYETAEDGAGIVLDDQRRESVDTAFETARLLFPAAGLAAAGMTLVLAYLLAAGIAVRTGTVLPRVPPFGLWRLPFWPVWVLAVALAGALWGAGTFRGFCLNTAAVCGFAFLINGAAVLRFRTVLKKLPAGFVFMLYVFLFMALPVSALVLALVGLFDAWFDYRKLTVTNT